MAKFTTFTLTTANGFVGTTPALQYTTQAGNLRTIKIFDTLEIEGFDDDGICEIFWDFKDWGEGSPKELTVPNMIEALREWGLLEELGLKKYAKNSNLEELLAQMLINEFKAFEK